jgi:hypothetical protein
MRIIITILSFLFIESALSLEPLAEEELQQVLGQGGVYLSGDITINDTGGPLNNTDDSSNPVIWQTNCAAASTNKRCGARIAVNAGSGVNSGWLVLDNIRGRFSFEGLTLKTRTIDGSDSGFGGDGATFNNDVLEIGLPNKVSYGNVSYTLANSSQARPTDAGFSQTDIFNVKIDGDVSLRGNMLIFPTGTP